ncbi:MAG: hypothetical protein NZ519_06880 [Bacteroidia bacterium]|nr:hypothetical protein [Bacteroidia bacterium]MDW8301951.1 hypothetical protein [Bacteroidia bacterium]
MGLGKKIIDFIAPPIKQKVPKQQTTQPPNPQNDPPKKKPKIGVQEIQEIEHEVIESKINTPTESHTTDIPVMEVEEYTPQKESETPTSSQQTTSVETEPTALPYEAFEATIEDLETKQSSSTEDLDAVIENITSQSLANDTLLNQTAFEDTTAENTLPLENYQEDKDNLTDYTYSTISEEVEAVNSENSASTLISTSESTANFYTQEQVNETQKVENELIAENQEVSTEKFISFDNEKSITLPTDTNMQTELSSLDYQPADIQKIIEEITLQAPAMNALLKNAVRTIMQRRGIQEITSETLPLIKDDLSLVLEASGSNISTMVGDVLHIKKVVNDKINQRREQINQYKNELTQKISELLAQVRKLEGEVNKLDNVIYTDMEELNKINKTLDTYQMLLASISEQKFNFE